MIKKNYNDEDNEDEDNEDEDSDEKLHFVGEIEDDDENEFDDENDDDESDDESDDALGEQDLINKIKVQSNQGAAAQARSTPYRIPPPSLKSKIKKGGKFTKKYNKRNNKRKTKKEKK